MSVDLARRILNDNPEASAEQAGLHYVAEPGEQGYRRKRWGRGFRLLDAEGNTVRSTRVKDRVERLVIPPAWEEVWIACREDCHVQAIGRDAAGRKQYIYHQRWRSTRDLRKYARLVALGRVLPQARRTVSADLTNGNDLNHARVMAALARLLETTLIRVGNDEYAQQHQTFGLTTIRKKHVAHLDRRRVVFDFAGKSSKPWRVEVTDPDVVCVVQQCMETPGYEIFKYYDACGRKRDATSSDVNSYLREVTGAHVTAKDFRTLGGTLLAACALSDFARNTRELPSKRLILRAIERTAECLNNTPQICRSSYVHPAILDGKRGDLLELAKRSGRRVSAECAELTPEERSAWAASVRTPAFERAMITYLERRWLDRLPKGWHA
jgi:DNA topoisomerase-1